MRRRIALILAGIMLLSAMLSFPAGTVRAEDSGLTWAEEEAGLLVEEESQPGTEGQFPPLNEDGFLDEGEFVWAEDSGLTWAEEEAGLLVEEESQPGTEGQFPPLNEDGFLDEGEFVWADDDAGVWRYCSSTLYVEIFRRTRAKPKLVWYEAEIRAADGEIFRMLPWSTTKRMSSLNYPYKIARSHKTVFAINSDFAHLRLQKKMRAGILLRDGEIIYRHTNKRNKGTFPNLDTLAIMPDGDMQVFWSDEKTAEEYVEMGAVDVLSFGPWLIRDGELNTKALKKFGTGSSPRTGIGMVEKGHYFAVMTEGRHPASLGSSIRFVAERLQELGCTTAFNLDGGQSSAILFMGHQICLVTNSSGRRASARKSAEILGIGTSDLCAAMEDDF